MIELLVVLALVSIFALTAVPDIRTSSDHAELKAMRHQMEAMAFNVSAYLNGNTSASFDSNGTLKTVSPTLPAANSNQVSRLNQMMGSHMPLTNHFGKPFLFIKGADSTVFAETDVPKSSISFTPHLANASVTSNGSSWRIVVMPMSTLGPRPARHARRTRKLLESGI